MDTVDKPVKALEEFIKTSISLSTERDINLLLSQILSASRHITHAECGQIYILDYTKRYLNPEVYQNDLISSESQYLTQIPLYLDNNRNNIESICAYSAFSGLLVNIEDIYSHTGFDFKEIYQHDRKTGYKTRSCLTIPLYSYTNVTIGILQLQNRRNPDNEEIEAFPSYLHDLVSAFSSQAAIALDNSLLIKKNQELINSLNKSNRQLSQENTQLKQKISKQSQFQQTMIGESMAMKQVFNLIDKVLDNDVTVFIKGESGTGKELIAKAIHQHGRRKDKVFIAQNCSALPEALLESELFGYKKGAFSGADKDKEGLIQAADGGTLFLDEIGDMPINLQPKILRVLQEKELRPLGSNITIPVDVRIIAATHKNIEELVKNGEFREDLYYRLHIYPVELPPLRARKEDIPPLLNYYLSKYNEIYHRNILSLSTKALDLLLAYDYSGNIRELSNIIECAVIRSDNQYILPEHLQLDRKNKNHFINTPADKQISSGLKAMLGEYEMALIRQELQKFNGNQTHTAKSFGISRRSLIEKINRYQINAVD